MTPETVTLRYVEVSLAELAAKVSVDEAKLKAYYEEQKSKNPERYVQPEQRRVRHILLSVERSEGGRRGQGQGRRRREASPRRRGFRQARQGELAGSGFRAAGRGSRLVRAQGRAWPLCRGGLQHEGRRDPRARQDPIRLSRHQARGRSSLPPSRPSSRQGRSRGRVPARRSGSRSSTKRRTSSRTRRCKTTRDIDAVARKAGLHGARHSGLQPHRGRRGARQAAACLRGSLQPGRARRTLELDRGGGQGQWRGAACEPITSCRSRSRWKRCARSRSRPGRSSAAANSPAPRRRMRSSACPQGELGRRGQSRWASAAQPPKFVSRNRCRRYRSMFGAMPSTARSRPAKPIYSKVTLDNGDIAVVDGSARARGTGRQGEARGCGAQDASSPQQAASAEAQGLRRGRARRCQGARQSPGDRLGLSLPLSQLLHQFSDWYLVRTRPGRILADRGTDGARKHARADTERDHHSARRLSRAHAGRILAGRHRARGTAGSWIGAALDVLGGPLPRAPAVHRAVRALRGLGDPAKIELAERWSAHYGWAGVFFSRLLPVIRHLIGIPAGHRRMDFRWYSAPRRSRARCCGARCSPGSAERSGSHPELLEGSLHRFFALVMVAAPCWRGCITCSCSGGAAGRRALDPQVGHG